MKVEVDAAALHEVLLRLISTEPHPPVVDDAIGILCGQLARMSDESIELRWRTIAARRRNYTYLGRLMNWLKGWKE